MTATATAAGDTVTKKKRALGLLLLAGLLWLGGTMPVQAQCCLLYTSDAADEARSVSVGGRRVM